MHTRTLRALCLSFIVLIVAACNNAQPEVKLESTTYRAHADVRGIGITVTLVPSHPFQHEYEKRIEIRKGGDPVTSFSLNDPGGFASIYVIDEGDRLLVVDGLSNGKAIDRKTGGVHDVQPNALPADFDMHNLGRFSFVDTGNGYGWIASPGPDGVARPARPSD
ncbi:MAG: hypothetical protein ACLGI6_16590 [Gammaproteobacteria bacterium]